jgi:hypothetical protein
LFGLPISKTLPISPPIQAKKSVVPFLYTASLLRPRRACAGPLLLDDRLLHLVRRARQSCSSPKNALPLLLSWGAPPDPSGECALSSGLIELHPHTR